MIAHSGEERTQLNVMALCAGAGGLDLGISLALEYWGQVGRGICYVEREVAAAASLVASMEAGWFYPAPVWSDLLTFDARPWRGIVHILASGDPCQDNSNAGKRAGSKGSRFLAPEVCRIAAECRPDIVFRENVPGNAGGQLEAIVPALEELGYRVAAGIFSSRETGNTMQRERLFIMAHRTRERCRETRRSECGCEEWTCCRCGTLDGTANERHERPGDAWNGSAEFADAGDFVDGANGGGYGRKGHARNEAILAYPSSRARFLPPTVIPAPNDNRGWIEVLDRFPEYQPALSKEEAESHIRRGIDAMAHRVERLRATGNGVDPVVAAYAFLSLGALLQCE